MRGLFAFLLAAALGVGRGDDKPPPAPRGAFDGGPTCMGVDSRPPRSLATSTATGARTTPIPTRTRSGTISWRA